MRKFGFAIGDGVFAAFVAIIVVMLGLSIIGVFLFWFPGIAHLPRFLGEFLGLAKAGGSASDLSVAELIYFVGTPLVTILGFSFIWLQIKQGKETFLQNRDMRQTKEFVTALEMLSKQGSAGQVGALQLLAEIIPNHNRFASAAIGAVCSYCRDISTSPIALFHNNQSSSAQKVVSARPFLMAVQWLVLQSNSLKARGVPGNTVLAHCYFGRARVDFANSEQKSVFQDFRFEQCHFIDFEFQNATFVDCEIGGAVGETLKFKNCSFNRVEFHIRNMDYAGSGKQTQENDLLAFEGECEFKETKLNGELLNPAAPSKEPGQGDDKPTIVYLVPESFKMKATLASSN